MTTAQLLYTNYEAIFLEVTDVLGNPLNASIINGVIAATCNGVAMVVSPNGYFTSTACTTGLTIVNTVNGATLYYAATIVPAIFTSIKLNRFVYPTIQF
jgi:hypothetical protein